MTQAQGLHHCPGLLPAPGEGIFLSLTLRLSFPKCQPFPPIPDPLGCSPLSLTFPCFHSMPGTSAWVLLILTESHCREQKGGWGLEKWKSGLGDTMGKPSPAEQSGGTCAHPLVHWEGAESHPGTEPCPHSGHSRSRAWRDKENNPRELALIWEQLPGQGQMLHTNSISGVKIPSTFIAGSALFIIPPKGILL